MVCFYENTGCKHGIKYEGYPVVIYQNNKRIIMQHIGSAHTSETLKDLILIAEE
jgi:hypothetical protein